MSTQMKSNERKIFAGISMNSELTLQRYEYFRECDISGFCKAGYVNK